MDQLIELRKRYNFLLERNKKAEEYFKTHTLKECIKKEFKGKTPLYGFYEIIIDLSGLIIEIEEYTGQSMTHDELINGFKA
ncbi:hypothetical protein CLPUN_35660 [Clostridium puniceum]|uniref:Uncharacterized protein n=1 Tax=Clostridium puniceum TaxID=29367 RepID=A0A1S8TBY7_9CLOT|nr:hypothetical protein [Clostridium puniceum]OOM75129.1 hypothetical protein CLPUN_35660 [Clostridium puniceum]